MLSLPKLQPGDRVAILSPSFAAPGRWPHVHALGRERLRDLFGLEPVDFPATSKVGASGEERARDLIAAFEDESIKGVIASLGGDDQVTYIKHLPAAPFRDHPKPFFGYSDNTHFANFLWLQGVPSFYGGSLFVQFAEQGVIHPFTERWLRRALFAKGEFALEASDEFNEVGLNWDDPAMLTQRREFLPNAGWQWDGARDGEGILWGGCLESIDELLRHGVAIPSLADFESIVLMTETSEEMPSADSVRRVWRALGERGILERVQGVLVGRPKAWEFNQQRAVAEREAYRTEQFATTLEVIRRYNATAPVALNLDFGHTDPQIAMPYGMPVRIVAGERKVYARF